MSRAGYTEVQRRRAFEALVLQGIWAVMRYLMVHFQGSGVDCNSWRGNAIGYLDSIDEDPGGNPEARRQHRRDVGFPPLY